MKQRQSGRNGMLPLAGLVLAGLMSVATDGVTGAEQGAPADFHVAVNGKEAARGAGKNPLTPNPDLNFRLGSGFAGGRFFNGALDDFRIYRRALSADEVQAVIKE